MELLGMCIKDTFKSNAVKWSFCYQFNLMMDLHQHIHKYCLRFERAEEKYCRHLGVGFFQVV